MNNKDIFQHLYEVYQYTVNFDFSKLNKYKKADDDLCISDLILDYTMLYEFYKERNKNYKYIGIELTEEYLPIAKARIEYVCNLQAKELKDMQMSIFDLYKGEQV